MKTTIINKMKKTNNDKKSSKDNELSSEDNWDWDISSCREFDRYEREATTMKMIVLPQKIINVRKCKGWKLELLIEYNTGERMWTMLHGALMEKDNDMIQLTKEFMDDNQLDFMICGYMKDPTLYKGKKK